MRRQSLIFQASPESLDGHGSTLWVFHGHLKDSKLPTHVCLDHGNLHVYFSKQGLGTVIPGTRQAKSPALGRQCNQKGSMPKAEAERRTWLQGQRLQVSCLRFRIVMMRERERLLDKNGERAQVGKQTTQGPHGGQCHRSLWIPSFLSILANTSSTP